jgi:hypothetical protein
LSSFVVYLRINIPYQGAECQAHTHTHKHTGCRNEIPQKEFYLFSSVYKFVDKVCNWTEHIHPVEEDILKIAIHYSLREDVTEGRNLKIEVEQELANGLWKDTK